MADLSTLNAGNPPDGEGVSLGALRIREVAAALLASFGLEHNLAGTHKRVVDVYNGYQPGVIVPDVNFQDMVTATPTIPAGASVWLMATVKVTSLLQGHLRYEFKVGATVLAIPASDSVLAFLSTGAITTLSVQGFMAAPATGAQPCAFRCRATDGTMSVENRALTVLVV